MMTLLMLLTQLLKWNAMNKLTILLTILAVCGLIVLDRWYSDYTARCIDGVVYKKNWAGTLWVSKDQACLTIRVPTDESE
jgi:hypothetical protein